MLAAETNGPTKEEVLPTIANKAKKRNSFPRGQTSDTILHQGFLEGITFEHTHKTDWLETRRRPEVPRLH